MKEGGEGCVKSEVWQPGFRGARSSGPGPGRPALGHMARHRLCFQKLRLTPDALPRLCLCWASPLLPAEPLPGALSGVLLPPARTDLGLSFPSQHLMDISVGCSRAWTAQPRGDISTVTGAVPHCSCEWSSLEVRGRIGSLPGTGSLASYNI